MRFCKNCYSCYEPCGRQQGWEREMNERQLLIDYKANGNVAALQTLVTMHQGFVRRVAKGFGYDPNTSDDIFQEGILGLIHAINKYDLKYDVKLISYGTFWIRYYISRYLKATNKYVVVTTLGINATYPGPSPEDMALRGVLHDRIDEAVDKVLASVDSREKDIFNARYRESKETSFRELGSRHGITRQRAHEISVSTLDKIRKAL